jgi:hypothetical protein
MQHKIVHTKQNKCLRLYLTLALTSTSHLKLSMCLLPTANTTMCLTLTRAIFSANNAANVLIN